VTRKPNTNGLSIRVQNDREDGCGSMTGFGVMGGSSGSGRFAFFAFVSVFAADLVSEATGASEGASPWFGESSDAAGRSVLMRQLYGAVARYRLNAEKQPHRDDHADDQGEP
jgi:hypothetical protein